MTNVGLKTLAHLHFPVVVLTSDVVGVRFIDNPNLVPELPRGASYLIPEGEDVAIMDRLNAGLSRKDDGRWVLRVRRLGADRQHIELFWMSNGYSGGGYEATRRSITPLYRKITGPGFAFAVGGLAFVINAALWLTVLLPALWWRRHRDTNATKYSRSRRNAS